MLWQVSVVEAGEQRDEALQQVDRLTNNLQQAQASLQHYQARTCLQTVSLFRMPCAPLMG